MYVLLGGENHFEYHIFVRNVISSKIHFNKINIQITVRIEIHNFLVFTVHIKCFMDLQVLMYICTWPRHKTLYNFIAFCAKYPQRQLYIYQ